MVYSEISLLVAIFSLIQINKHWIKCLMMSMLQKWYSNSSILVHISTTSNFSIPTVSSHLCFKQNLETNQMSKLSFLTRQISQSRRPRGIATLITESNGFLLKMRQDLKLLNMTLEIKIQVLIPSTRLANRKN